MDKKQIATLLKDSRMKNRLSGSEVARRLVNYGIILSPKTIWGYENGASTPPVPVFAALCQIYGISVIEPDRQEEPIVLSDRERRILDLFRAASPELQALAIKLLDPLR